MPKLVILGSANAIADPDHENTHMALAAGSRVVMIDCVNNPVIRLPQAGLELNRVTDLILTHFHPDHVSGVPLMLMNSWLLGRKEPLRIHGLAHCLDRIEALMDAYEWKTWPRFFPVHFNRLPEREMVEVLHDQDFHILASPVRHLVPTIGLRVEFTQSKRTLAYSCDTEPCPAVVRLAEGVEVLIHESTGAGLGHSSPAQAGEIARQAEAGCLYLIHYPTGPFTRPDWIQRAQETYPGPVQLATDFMEIEF